MCIKRMPNMSFLKKLFKFESGEKYGIDESSLEHLSPKQPDSKSNLYNDQLELIDGLTSLDLLIRQKSIMRIMNKGLKELEAVEEAIYSLMGKREIEFYTPGSIQGQSSDQAYDKVLQLGRDGKLVDDVVQIQSLFEPVDRALQGATIAKELLRIVDSKTFAIFQLLVAQLALSKKNPRRKEEQIAVVNSSETPREVIPMKSENSKEQPDFLKESYKQFGIKNNLYSLWEEDEHASVQIANKLVKERGDDAIWGYVWLILNFSGDDWDSWGKIKGKIEESHDKASLPLAYALVTSEKFPDSELLRNCNIEKIWSILDDMIKHQPEWGNAWKGLGILFKDNSCFKHALVCWEHAKVFGLENESVEDWIQQLKSPYYTRHLEDMATFRNIFRKASSAKDKVEILHRLRQ